MKCYWGLAGIGIKQTYGNRSLGHIFQFPVKTVLVLTYMLHPHKEGKETTSSSYGVFNIYSSL